MKTEVIKLAYKKKMLPFLKKLFWFVNLYKNITIYSKTSFIG